MLGLAGPLFAVGSDFSAGWPRGLRGGGGRAQPLPSWTGCVAVEGQQGGSREVTANLENAPTSAVPLDF